MKLYIPIKKGNVVGCNVNRLDVQGDDSLDAWYTIHTGKLLNPQTGETLQITLKVKTLSMMSR